MTSSAPSGPAAGTASSTRKARSSRVGEHPHLGPARPHRWWADKPIQTYGYIAPGFEVNVERKLFHWNDKWNENFKEYVEEKEITPDAD